MGFFFDTRLIGFGHRQFLGNSARFRLLLWACQFLVCPSVALVSVCLYTFVRTGRTLAKIKNVKNDVCRF